MTRRLGSRRRQRVRHFAGPQFEPTDLSGCVLWLQADLGVTLNGSNVSAAADQSGNGNDFVQATAADQPGLILSAYKGRAVFRGADTTDHLQHASSLSLGTACTLLLAMKQGSTASQYVTNDSGLANGIISRFSGALVEWFNGSGTDRHTFANGPTGINIYTLRQTNAVALQGWFNGTSAFGPVVPNAALTNLQSILARGNATSGSAACDIGAVVVYSRALADAERMAVERWLGGVYGVAVA